MRRRPHRHQVTHRHAEERRPWLHEESPAVVYPDAAEGARLRWDAPKSRAEMRRLERVFARWAVGVVTE